MTVVLALIETLRADKLKAENERLRATIAVQDDALDAMAEANTLITKQRADIIARDATIADLTAQRDASISDVVRMGSLYDKCAAKDATIGDLTALLLRIEAQDMSITGTEIRAAIAQAEGRP